MHKTISKAGLRTSLALFTSLCLLAGCGTRSSSDGHAFAKMAHDAETRGDWAGAVKLWVRAIQKEKGLWPIPDQADSPKTLAVYYYELGRSQGVIGLYDNAERNLLQALQLDEKFKGPNGMDYVELARLNHAWGRNDRAAAYFKQAMPHLEETSEQAPAEYVAVMNEAVTVAKALNDDDWAKQLTDKAKFISGNYPDLKLPDDWTPYKNNGPSNH